MFNSLRHQCRYVTPLVKLQPSLGSRSFSNRIALAAPSCSEITAKRHNSQMLSAFGRRSSLIALRYATRAKVAGPITPPIQLTFKDAEKRVLKAIKSWDRFPQDKLASLTMDTRFVEDLGLDSLDLVEVTMALEDEFELEFPETLVDKLKTPKDVYTYVCKEEDVHN